MTTSDKPAPGHPAPWRWFDHALLDANGEAIVARTYGPRPDSGTAELLRAAPELADLLRVLVDQERPATTCSRTGPCQCEIHRARALLDSIDAARKAGG